MYYVALVADRNTLARSRVLSAYVNGTPCAFFDGGYRAMMGGFPAGGESLVPYYEPEIIAATQRPVPPLDLFTAIDWLGNNQVRVHVALGNGVTANTAPPTPSILSGGGRGKPGQSSQFTSGATDPEANMVYYKWDWGDEQISDWLGPYPSGTTVPASHVWSERGDYEVKVKVRDPFGEETAWSTPVSIRISCCTGQVGDANNSGEETPTIGDISTMIDALFISGNLGVISCLAEGDVNQSGGNAPQAKDITISDISMLIDYLFITGPSLGLPTCW
jgi:hypothetical protein